MTRCFNLTPMRDPDDDEEEDEEDGVQKDLFDSLFGDDDTEEEE